MGEPAFRPIDPDRDRYALVELITSEEWSHRTRPVVGRAEVEAELERGDYAGDDAITLMIEVDGEVVGLVRAEGLTDEHGDPQLDFRLRERVRGRGIGATALRRITDEVFTRYPHKRRIEGQTRRDNVAMRRVFAGGGYVQEAVYRRAWPVVGSDSSDGIGYAILREDWETGTVTPVEWD
jgi:RimJ/RimL family protein N-acetyltransferase